MDWGVLGGKGQKKRNLDNHNNIIQKKLKNSLTYSIFSKNWFPLFRERKIFFIYYSLRDSWESGVKSILSFFPFQCHNLSCSSFLFYYTQYSYCQCGYFFYIVPIFRWYLIFPTMGNSYFPLNIYLDHSRYGSSFEFLKTLQCLKA